MSDDKQVSKNTAQAPSAVSTFVRRLTFACINQFWDWEQKLQMFASVDAILRMTFNEASDFLFTKKT